ncbi:MAG: hypothetical protein LBO79_01595 [Zoogloeaceae bacterium]|jgi:hypothetical protein|nr:hypothetical protein [Zoogloeaceae bacterium]
MANGKMGRVPDARLRLAVVFACGCVMLSAGARNSETADDAWTALAQTKVSGSLMYFQRHRERYRIDEDRFGGNLHHRTLQGQVDISTPYFLKNVIGVEAGIFATTDLANGASPDHEISFFPWRNPWSADWLRRDARGGFSLYRAHLKLRHVTDHGDWWGKLGYFQPGGPGVLGVNWSLMPGTYAGVEGGVDSGPFSVAGACVTRYKAPWYRGTYAFLDNERRGVGHLWSLGARYAPNGSPFSAEVAYGEAPGYLRSAHLKLKHRTGARYLSYQLYVMGDHDGADSPNNHYAGNWAFQHYLAFSRTFAPYVFRAEFTHTRAPSRAPRHLGYFVYRLSGWYGGANGAYEPWWDNRSDWNHNRESAVFFSLTRTLDDIGLSGVHAGVSIARGWNGKVYGVREELREAAWSVDLGYRVLSGPLRDTRLTLHYTRYDNRTRQPGWTGYRNLFQDERDLKVLIVVPW